MIRASKIETVDKGKKEFDDFIKRFEKVRGAYVTVGFHKEAGEYQDGTDVIQVALWNEFGTKKIPERSFVRSAIDGHMDSINTWREELIGKMLNNGLTMHKALEIMGFRIQVLIQNQIKSNVPPTNAASTVEHKRREGIAPNTLIETGLMLRSVTFKVVGA